MNKKILISLAVICAAAAIAVGATTAFFSDTETSTGNTFTAGELDLKVDDECTYNGVEQNFCTFEETDLTDELFFDYGDIKPGDEGENTISLHVYNNDSYVCAQIADLANAENGCTEPEDIDDASCDNPGVTQGELQDYLLFTIWKDTDCDNELDEATEGYCTGYTGCEQWTNEDECLAEQCQWTPGQSGEQVLVADQPASNGLWPIADSQTGGPLKGDTTTCIGVNWGISPLTGNIIQGDSLTGNVIFTATQARHNDGFTCMPR